MACDPKACAKPESSKPIAVLKAALSLLTCPLKLPLSGEGRGQQSPYNVLSDAFTGSIALLGVTSVRSPAMLSF